MKYPAMEYGIYIYQKKMTILFRNIPMKTLKFEPKKIICSLGWRRVVNPHGRIVGREVGLEICRCQSSRTIYMWLLFVPTASFREVLSTS